MQTQQETLVLCYANVLILAHLLATLPCLLLRYQPQLAMFWRVFDQVYPASTFRHALDVALRYVGDTRDEGFSADATEFFSATGLDRLFRIARRERVLDTEYQLGCGNIQDNLNELQSCPPPLQEALQDMLTRLQEDESPTTALLYHQSTLHAMISWSPEMKGGILLDARVREREMPGFQVRGGIGICRDQMYDLAWLSDIAVTAVVDPLE